MFFGGGYYYYLPILLQGFCAVHSIRSGTQSKWLWIIIFVPVLGSLIYIYSEILSARKLKSIKIDGAAIINPGVKLKRLEEDLKFADTFANRTKLADAYLQSGQTEKAIELYKSCLTGAFADNELVISKLVQAYYQQQNYAEAIAMALKIKSLPTFNRSKSHLFYAWALEQDGKSEQAEQEFKLMKGRYSNFEQRYEYGQFLQRAGRNNEASDIYAELLDEQAHLSPAERSNGKVWFNKAKAELKRL